MVKTFRMKMEDLQELAPRRGGGVASDRIMVNGCSVGFKYRGTPKSEYDSGWAFLAGDESQAHMDDVANHGVYDVNVIANADLEIIPLLDASIGSAFVRTHEGLVIDPLGSPE